MLRHKFAPGQTVDFLPGPLDRNVPRGAYKIERQLPTDGIGLQYRVRHVADGHERVVNEEQLAAGGAISRAGASAPTGTGAKFSPG